MPELNIPTPQEIDADTTDWAQSYSAGGQYLAHQALQSDDLTGW
jgi:hypothetical protein